MASYPIIPSQLPSGFCPADYQEMWNGFASHGSVVISDTDPGGISVSTSKPPPEHEDRPWLQLDQFGSPIRIYYFAGGAWISLHTIAPGLTMWWFEDLPDFTDFDGGDSDTVDPGLTTGPMWRQAKTPDGTLIAAQFPIAAGTLPSTTVLAVGDTGGEENHILTQAELPAIKPTFQYFNGNDSVSGGDAKQFVDGPSTSPPAGGVPNNATKELDTLGSGAGHNNMPPYVVGYLLQRTVRQYYRVP